MGAIYDSIKAAREYTVFNSKPIMVELMTYRGSHHSTSDDSTRYRDPSEIIYWNKIDNPIIRAKKLLKKLGILNDKKDEDIREQFKFLIIDSYRKAERKQKPRISKMFEDVFYNKPWHLIEQE